MKPSKSSDDAAGRLFQGILGVDVFTSRVGQYEVDCVREHREKRRRWCAQESLKMWHSLKHWQASGSSHALSPLFFEDRVVASGTSAEDGLKIENT
jgi:hypothetical protein